MRHVITDPRHFYPVRPEPRRIRKSHPMAAVGVPLGQLPSVYDFYSFPGIPGPIRNQGQEGSCTGHGWRTGAMIKRNMQKMAPIGDLSPQFIYGVERLNEGDFTSDAGAQVGTGALVLETQGVCREEMWPYTPDDLFAKPSDAAYADALLHQAGGHARLDGSPEAICDQLARGNPVVFGFHVHSSFEGDAVAHSGIVPLPGSGERDLGGHCMCFTGYKVTQLAKPGGNCLTRLLGGGGASDGWLWADNSWGDQWGQAGRCQMSFEFVRKYVFDCTALLAMQG